MDYTAIGQTTHLAARMEQMAMPGSILMTADTLSLAEGYVQVKPLGPVNVKGMSEPVEVYEITGAGRCALGCKPRPRADSLVSSGATLRSRRSAKRWSEPSRPRPGGCRCRGARSRKIPSVLGVHAFPSHRDWLILESGSVSYGKATPYLPVIDLLKAYFKITIGIISAKSVRKSLANC